MNVLYLSPAFPPTTPSFCHALAAEGVNVIGLGDEPIPTGSPVLEALRHYVHEPRMGEYEALRGAARALMSEHGPFDRIESNGEHWLALEARLRDELGVAGMDSESVARKRSKLGMSGLFAQAGIPYPPTIPASDASAVRALAREHGLPLVFKPETGSGAENTFRVRTDGALEEALDRQPYGHVVQPFIDAPIVTYDGLADRDGGIVFATSHVYDQGIMQIRERDGDGHYYSLRELPPGLEELGRRAVAAFEVRERFFHLECFQHEDGRYTALEMNLRPPGGFTTEMMNAACDIDVYALWARVLVGRDVRDFRYGRRYHTAHAGRRAGRHYRLSTEDLLTELNGSFLAQHGVPPAFAVTMGDAAYLLRHPRLEELKRAIALVQELS